jgi:amino acid adenylation domain-containing protein
MEVETGKILVDFNRTGADCRRDLCIHQLFEAQVERTPDATAVVCEEQRLSYRELNSRANRLAHYLRNRGAGPDVLVGICVERSPEMLVGILGILKAGAAYVPLDHSYPEDRLAVMLEDAKAPLVLTQSPLLENLLRRTSQAIYLDTEWPGIALESAENCVSQVKPENLSYVLFTSGSTGRPKGVAIEHRSSASFIQWAQSVFAPQEVEGTLFSTSLCFDLSVFEMFVPLSMGGKVIVVKNALFLPRSRAANEVTLINTVPSAIAELVRTEAVPTSVQVVNLAGEALLTSLVERIYEKTRTSKVYNLYGPTEYTTYATYTLVPRGAEVTIGRPLSNTQVYILDENRRPTPLGVPGELHLAGDGLARGYFGSPDLTAERFLPNPFNLEPGARMYRTGDLACFLPDGNIQYLGRMDNQVKIRGFRIELGEIESVLTRHLSVQSAVVVAREDRPGEKRLVAYVVHVSPGHISTSALQTFLRRTLPEYMVPSAFVSMETLPLMPNGKIDRRALLAPGTQFRDDASRVAARDPLESMLLQKWEEALGTANLGITDNFFDLGGYSLTAARLLFEIEKVIGREIPLSALLRGATVERLAKLIRERSESTPDPVVMTIQEGNSSAPFFAVVPPGEDSLGYAILARHMGADQPVYKLQGSEPVIAGQRPAFAQEELRTLSLEYIAAMRAAQPEGPYCLGALCDGVQIAERMVLDLEAQGHEVGLFAIFDTWVLQNVQRPLLWRLAYYGERLQALRKMNIGEQVRAYKQALQSNLRRVVRPGQPAVKREVQQAYWPEDFAARRFRAPVALFKNPKQPFFYVDDPYLGWGARSEGGVEIHEVNFDHEEIFREPHVRTVGELLANRLRRVGERRQATQPHARIPLLPALSENA